jgi:predicted transposase YdaD
MRTIADSYIDEGMNKGSAIGEARGEARGAEQGANTKAMEIAKRMLQENTDIKFISSVTGLSNDEILKLKNRI